jgi:hypothetical protein
MSGPWYDRDVRGAMRRYALARRTRRVRIAIAALVVWVVGLELGPNLHLALHDRLGEHTHAGESTTFVASHTHADGSVHRIATHRTRRDAETRLAAALAHGRNSLAHRSAAIAAKAPPIIAPLPVDRPTLLVEAITASAPTSHGFARATARGPPANALG